MDHRVERPTDLMNNTDRKPSDQTDNAFASLDGRKLVYIRAIAASDVLSDLEGAFEDAELEVEAGAIIYSVHDEDGERLALVGDRELAFAAARQHELTPVSVH